MTDDITEKLFTDESVFDVRGAVEILEPYVRLTKEGHMIFLASFHRLTNERKLTIVLLSRKILGIKNITNDTLSPSEVQRITGLSVGTVNPTLSSLAAKGILRNNEGRYSIPSYAMENIKKMFDRNGVNSAGVA